MEEVANNSMYIEKCTPGATGEDVGLHCHLHSVHPSNNHFKRLIAFASSKHANMQPPVYRV